MACSVSRCCWASKGTDWEGGGQAQTGFQSHCRALEGHSLQWIQRHAKDRWVQRAHEQMYRCLTLASHLRSPGTKTPGRPPFFCRSRAAFKLKQLDEKYKLFNRRGDPEAERARLAA